MPKISYSAPGKLKANQLFRAQIQIELTEEVRQEGRIAVAVRHVSDFGKPQTDDQEAEN